MTFLSLFAGIGGMDLGLERAGLRCIGQVEIDPFCRAVLAKHWPDVKRFEDIRSFGHGAINESVDLVCGGVPCQPASVAGRRKGSADPRWLWPEFLRVIRECRPKWVLAENVRGFVNLEPHGLDWYCAEMEREGYEVQPVVFGAEHVGAPHKRSRVWIVAKLAYTARHCYEESGTEQERVGESGEQCEYSQTNSIGRLPRTWDQPSTRQRPRADITPKCRERESLANPLSRRGESREQEQVGQAQGRTAADGAGHCCFIGGCWRCGDELANSDSALTREQRESRGRSFFGDGGELEHANNKRRNSSEREATGAIDAIAYGSNSAILADAGEPRLEERRNGAGGAGDEYAMPSSGGRNRWPARPGRQQYDWEAPRLSAFQVGQPVAGPSGDVVRTVRSMRGCSAIEAEAWWQRNKVRLDRAHNRNSLKALGNLAVPACAEMIGRAILMLHEKECAA